MKIFIISLLLAIVLTAVPYTSEIVDNSEEFTLSGESYYLKVLREKVDEEYESIISAPFEFRILSYADHLKDSTILRLDCSGPVLLILMARDKVVRNVMCNSEVINIYSPNYNVVGIVESGKLETIKVKEDYHVEY